MFKQIQHKSLDPVKLGSVAKKTMNVRPSFSKQNFNLYYIKGTHKYFFSGILLYVFLKCPFHGSQCHIHHTEFFVLANLVCFGFVSSCKLLAGLDLRYEGRESEQYDQVLLH